MTSWGSAIYLGIAIVFLRHALGLRTQIWLPDESFEPARLPPVAKEAIQID